MHKIIRWFNQNRTEAIIIFAIIAFLFIILRVLNGIVGIQQEQRRNELSNTNNIENRNMQSDINVEDKAVIDGAKLTQVEKTTYKGIIKEFVNYCNTGKTEDVEKAYNMLSDECKEVLYPTAADFVKNYYLNIFYITRIYSLETWFSEGNYTTYYIKYTEDVLATGNVKSSDNKTDYITVVNTDNGYKLNIGSYIGRQKSIAKAVGNESVILTVNWADMYMDYTMLNVSVKNNTAQTICIDTKESDNSMFLYDEYEVQYSAFLNEITDEELLVESGKVNTLNIKFNKIYLRSMRGVYFTDIVLNYINYIEKLEAKDRVILYT